MMPVTIGIGSEQLIGCALTWQRLQCSRTYCQGLSHTI